LSRFTRFTRRPTQAGDTTDGEEDITMNITRHMGGERYRLELEALADGGAPAHVRLRAALKCLLRTFRLRCRSVADVTPRQVTASTQADSSASNQVGDLS
jgi:hypothetical protein